MKKILSVVAIALVIAVLLVSCGTTKTCPAYSSTDTEQSDGESC